MTLVMALVHLLPVGELKTSLVVQLLCAGCLLGVLYLLCDVGATVLDAPWGGVVAAVLGALCAPLPIWTLQGSDVGPATLLIFLALRDVTRAWKAGHPWPRSVFVWLGLGVLLRLDGVVPYLVFLAAAAVRRENRRGCLAALVGLVLLCGAIMAFGQVYYGDPLPNTYYLKATGSPRALVLRRGWSEIGELVEQISPFLLLTVAAGLLTLWRRNPVVLLASGLILGLTAYNIQVGGDWVPVYTSRFVAPALLLLVLLITISLWRSFEVVVRHGGEARWLRAVPAILALATAPRLSSDTAWREWLDPTVQPMYWAVNKSNAADGFYLKHHTAPRTSVAFHWAGVPAYFSERPAIDVLGKSDRHIARLRTAIFAPGHSKWDWDYVMQTRRPDIFQHASRGLSDRADFREQYLALLPATGGLFYVRRDAVSLIQDNDYKLALPVAGPVP
jgi:hypothetical protein